jgi:hypothetical protein
MILINIFFECRNIFLMFDNFDKCKIFRGLQSKFTKVHCIYKVNKYKSKMFNVRKWRNSSIFLMIPNILLYLIKVNCSLQQTWLPTPSVDWARDLNFLGALATVRQQQKAGLSSRSTTVCSKWYCNFNDCCKQIFAWKTQWKIFFKLDF